MPVVVYNYLDRRRQTVRVELPDADWFALTGDADARTGAGRRRSQGDRAPRQGHEGRHAQAAHDRTGRQLRRRHRARDRHRVPDGRESKRSQRRARPAGGHHARPCPPDAIEGSVKAFVKLYPSGLQPAGRGARRHLPDAARLLRADLLDDVSQRPRPRLPAAEPASRPRASRRRRGSTSTSAISGSSASRCSGGGFDWYGRARRRTTLTAYGLMEFEDMAKVHDVDPSLIARTRDWLIKQRRNDGSWDAGLGSEPSRRQRGHVASDRVHRLGRLPGRRTRRRRPDRSLSQ